VELGFTAAQENYVDVLGRPERVSALQQALKSVYGRDFEVRTTKVERAAPPAPVSAPPARPAAPPRPAPSRSSAPEETGAVETEVEFDDEGALPLPEQPAAEPVRGTDVGASGEAEDEDLGPPPAGEAAALEEPAEEPSAPPAAGDAAAAEHPLVKTLVAGFEGEIVRVDAGAGGSAGKGRTRE
jgi:hypothetical protein